MKEIIMNNYLIILIVAIMSVLSLIGYLVENFGRKDFKIKKNDERSIIDSNEEITPKNTNVEMENVEGLLSVLENENNQK